MQCHKILVVDDDPGILKLLSLRLRSKNRLVETAECGRQALRLLSEFGPDLVITDLRMAGMDGMALFSEIQASSPSLPVIILTAHGTIPDAVEAAQKGVFGYLTKPYDGKMLMRTVDKALKHKVESCRGSQDGVSNHWREEIVTQNLRMEETLNMAMRFAQSDVSVLIQSESGTGKELLAQAIHRASPRSDHSCVAVNCGAVPEALLEAELFGYKKGAFTGADRSRTGLFEEADKGTLFLDEVGNMSLEFQAKLLRVLQDGNVRPLGSTRSAPVDVRIIAATHDDLEKKIELMEFREDLYYRLNVVTLELPPLRKRLDDVPLLANYFLSNLNERSTNIVAKSFSPEAMETLTTAKWPGNIRQLLNVVEQVAVLSVAPVISDTAIRKALRYQPARLPSLATAQSEFEHDYLVRVLRITSGNVSQAARLAHRNRTEFYKLLHRHHLEPQAFR
ncbi:MAG: sigma 54-interacting transcriptional regulator [Porticoccaceae bacterium]|nr:sigma 54-interacting transcriptional regulator [Porticoccaceae bacterium]